ncbi:hypothetical protein [Anaerovorax sp. IOR16]|uniref:hypothetical protein n=1 Tax=Anaerovorax sp. IOR16 TaxID=2773458 RepID=UPI0019D19309|nr:hypothetical protein [Anaerovorax sp. IOR16]
MNLQFTEENYELLKKIFRESDVLMQEELLKFSIWQEMDLKQSEVNIGNVIIDKDNRLICIINKKMKVFNIANREAKEGELIFITLPSPILGDWAVGKCYKSGGIDAIDYGVFINAIDTYRETGEYSVGVQENQYIVLEEIGY